MKKVMTLLLIPIIALSIIGTSYALWSKTIMLTGTIETGTVDKQMANIDCQDQGLDPADIGVEQKDVGVCTANIDIGGHSGSVIIDNVYPSYRTDISVKEVNAGTIPLKINNVILTLYDSVGNILAQDICTSGLCILETPEIKVSFPDIFGTQIEPQGDITNVLNVHMKQGAIQGSTYGLKIEERADQWNE